MDPNKSIGPILNNMKLKLNSPVGFEPAVYRWPLLTKKGYAYSNELLETIQWACADIPDLQLPLKNNILRDYDVNSYESMKSLCQRYNRAIDSVLCLERGTQKFVDRINQHASKGLLHHILQQTYSAAVTNAEELNRYQAFSPDVYGETSFDLICQMIDQINITKDDVFIDLGSGVGQVVMQVAATTSCKLCIGIERAEVPTRYAVAMINKFKFWMQWYGKKYGNYQLFKGDFFDEKYRSRISEATVVFVNNFAFGPSVDHRLKERFADFKDGTKIISSKSFCSLNFRITDRNLNDIGTIMNVSEISPDQSSVSWTGKPISFYLHIIDRSKLEKYFQVKLNHKIEIGNGIEANDRQHHSNFLNIPKAGRRRAPRSKIKTERCSSITENVIENNPNNCLQKLMDLFKHDYTEIVEKMKNPIFKIDLQSQIEDEKRKNIYLKTRIADIQHEIEEIILRMEQVIKSAKC